jgi:hypothetical protein
MGGLDDPRAGLAERCPKPATAWIADRPIVIGPLATAADSRVAASVCDEFLGTGRRGERPPCAIDIRGCDHADFGRGQPYHRLRLDQQGLLILLLAGHEGAYCAIQFV